MRSLPLPASHMLVVCRRALGSGLALTRAAVLMKKAEKKAMVSLTQWKPDYEGAAALFEQAANVYKNSNRKKQAAVAFEKLSACKEKLGE